MPRLPVVAVVGRPNVGKSTLVNRIVGGRSAVVEALPGVTRDRREFAADWAGRSFLVVDTGGWEQDPDDHIGGLVKSQAEAAVTGADLILMVVDAEAGITSDDAAVADFLRSAQVPVLLAANKVDHAGREADGTELWSLGLGEPLAVSALHGRGTGDLLDRLVERLPEDRETDEPAGLPRLALVGRPNVGKSTLLNRLAGEERVIVDAQPGTTRDPIDIEVELDGARYELVDTAGIRRRPKIKEDADFYSVERARKVMAHADVSVVLIDGSAGVTHQDQQVVAEAIEAGTGLVILLNKWDAIDPEQREQTEIEAADRLAFVSWAPVLRVSAKTGARLRRLGPAVATALQSRRNRISTGELNRLLTANVARHPPPVRKGRRPKIHYVVQAGTEPPTFVLFVSGSELGDDYLRFLEGNLRQAADFTGTPLRLVVRGKSRR
ncbi:MAG TPA: ribosome biogenesis GTPase Der [Acidimicrobiia bacterium]|jgi:GTP-binding protein